jgi:hypothetical protein
LEIFDLWTGQSDGWSASCKFLDEIEANVPDDLDVHLVMDNYATHKTPLIRNWLAKGRAGMST